MEKRKKKKKSGRCFLPSKMKLTEDDGQSSKSQRDKKKQKSIPLAGPETATFSGIGGGAVPTPFAGGVLAISAGCGFGSSGGAARAAAWLPNADVGRAPSSISARATGTGTDPGQISRGFRFGAAAAAAAGGTISTGRA